MKKVYTDADLRRILGANRADSSIIDHKIQEAYAEIRKSSNANSGQRTGRIWKKAIGGFGAVAAAFILAMIFCAANPSLASEIPVLGSIFNKMQGIFPFGGIPGDEITYLQDDVQEGTDAGENVSGDEAGGTVSQGLAESTGIFGTSDDTSLSRYQTTDQGLTVTLTEYYASNQSIFIGVRVESEKAFPKMATFGPEHYQLLQLSTTETYSFRDEGAEVRGFRDLEGRLVDEHTFEGVIRIDYDSIKMDYRKYDAAVAEADRKGEPYPEINDDTRDYWIEEYKVPDSFQMQLQIEKIRGYLLSEEQVETDYRVQGTWTIPGTLDIQCSSANSAVIRIDETNAEGIGLEYIEISAVEMTLHPIQNGDRGIVAVALDKDGRQIRHGGTNGNELAIYGHDISVITVYICDYYEYMDELKGIGLQQGDEAFQEALEERALYKKTIDTTLYSQEK